MSTVALIEYIAENLVNEPDKVQVTEIEGDEKVIVELRVADEDIGKVIGKSGSVARALRTLIAAIGSREDKGYSLEIID